MIEEMSDLKFKKDVENHVMEILLDQGVYRHLKFSQPGTNNLSFHLITGPGYLLYRGDMGCYEFERLNDMFEFFTGKDINPGYWAEKVEAKSKDGDGVEKFSIETFTEKVKELAKDFLEERSPSDAQWIEEFNGLIDDMIDATENGYDAYDHITSWDFSDIDGGLETSDVFGSDAWEYDFTDYTYHYIWCCRAILWGVGQYNANR